MAIEINSPENPIHAVTVFKSQRAEIVRVFPLQLKAGNNKVEVKSLPGTIDTKSIRVSGLANTRLHDVVCLLNTRKQPSPTDSSEVIAALRRKKDAIQKEKDVFEAEVKILADYAQTLNGEHVSPEKMAAFLKGYVDQNKSNLASVAVLDDLIRDIEKQIREEENKSSLKRGPVSNGEVTMVIGAEVDTNIDLKLTYIVSGATWEPTYELHATTENGKPSSTVTLNYRARITQSTGEDWTDASLTLSTSNTSMNTTIPDLPSIKLRPKPMQTVVIQPVMHTMSASTVERSRMGSSLFKSKKSAATPRSVPPPAAPTVSASQPYGAAGGRSASEEDMGFALDEEYDEISPPEGGAATTPVVKDSALAVTYSVQGESTVPSDGIAHMVSIAELDFGAVVKYVAVPRVEAVVYLQCEVKNTSEYRLLPGSVSVILDESFVSQTSISDISAGDTFTCTLGVDPGTKVTYLRKATHSDTKAGTFTEAKRTTTYTVKVSITNKHTFALGDIIIREALPMVDVADQETSNSNKARVILRKPLGLADAKAGEVLTLDGQKASSKSDGGLRVRWQEAEGGQLGGDKDGKFEWFGGLKQGEKVELEAGWDIKTPEDVKWIEVTGA